MACFGVLFGFGGMAQEVWFREGESGFTPKGVWRIRRGE